MADTACLYTTLKNISGVSQTFGFIPPHGKLLGVGECVTVFGDVWDRLRTGGRLNERSRAAFESAVLNEKIEIIKSPNQFLYDVPATTVKMLSLTGGVLGVVDPCYGSYIGPAC